MVEGLERRPLGARVEGAPLHGRRRVRHRPAHGGARLRARAAAARCPTTWHAGARAVRRAPRRRRARRPRREPVRAAPRPCAPRPARRARCSAQLARGRAAACASWTGVVRPTPPSSLNGPIGPHRRWDWARTTLADVKTVRAALGGTVNDVVLTVLTRGFRDLLLARDEDVDGPRRAHAGAGVGAHAGRARHLQQPRVGDDRRAAGRARRPRASASTRSATQMDGLKESKQAVAGEVLTSLSGFAPSLLLALGTRVAMRIPQRNVNTVTTNVPGPQYQLYACGRPMLEAFPFVPLAEHRAHRRRDLLLQRHAQLRRHRRLRHRARHRRAVRAASRPE